MKARILLALALLTGLSGCATIFRSTLPVRHLNISSTPAGAAVLLDGKEVGQTPCIIDVLQTSNGHITLELAGYKPYPIVLQKHTYWAVFLDIIPAFLYWIAVLVVHNNDSDASWRDDWGKAAAFTLVPAAAALIIDLGTGSSRAFTKPLLPIQVTLIKQE